ncbi:MAG: hypothetical protein ACRCXL_04155 [Dermatophilaceae bacterium]
MAEHGLAVLDTSCVIAPPDNLSDIAEAAAVSTLTVVELAYGMHTSDPVRNALRERRYREHRPRHRRMSRRHRRRTAPTASWMARVTWVWGGE